MNIVNTTGNYLLYTLVETYSDAIRRPEDARSRQYVSLFQGSFDALVSRVTLVLQLFATLALIRWLGVRGVALHSAGDRAGELLDHRRGAASSAIVRIGKVLENSSDYSIQNTLRQALFLPTSREAKYKAKAAIDTFVHANRRCPRGRCRHYRRLLGLALMTFAGINVALTVAWLCIARQIAREHRKKTG